ncbi:4-hydroxy-3-methylbut-2-enyl diphosphate reductase [Suipraeoptans intestinalis]|uniref:4-hydroxy-3-methylbut-2-enyl diphosphate reductase n=1 Tax=Suipraeoptans intestinalis TaxID=2606628 RepID=UPI0023F0AE43|nr:4-hydroxy-3-methylbut-2-enyl diphosphate reductase [Suipraeoptans intestinalis]MDD7770740.1 4-hydroxy-3-methylbut-2-enyl diphosphate reductase [Suipraeoptans intestinalis]MDY3122262.1 4-hydroxy-3-methylbut-2-enyl diphosphate reductase [Suipraeoptans intestinalis]
MEIKLAKTAGFCFGVKRAVETVYEEIKKNTDKKVYTYGPIIHNEEVIKELAAMGVEVIRSEEELKKVTDGIVIIRSHGLPKRVYRKMEESGISYVDATCPFVKKIHTIVSRESAAGAHVVVIGNRTHPEVEGIRGWAGDRVSIIQTREEAEDFRVEEPAGRVCVVAQTTFNYKKFQELVEIIEKKGYDILVLNTICSATRKRQEEAGRIAKSVEAMIVIGDKRSSNTQKLFEICNKECLNTYYIQTLDDLDLNQLGSVETVGITAGASTPKNIIEEVQNNVGTNF